MKILVAEDHAPSARLLKRILEAMGHEVLIAFDGAEAWSIVEHESVRLVISDWQMPGLDGLELCRRIRGRSQDRYTYVVLVTGRGGKEDRLEGLDAGADDFLAKPLDPRELAARLKIARRILAMQEELERKNAVLVELATTDPLTGLRNRRWFAEALEAHASLASRQGLPLSLVMLDIDHFKGFNDTYGHPLGDGVLRAVSAILQRESRAHDLAARYGGEEFVVLLPMADRASSVAFAERIRAAIEEADWPLRPVTASLGVASLDADDSDPATLIEQADQALYRSKRLGRNRVTCFGELAFRLEPRASPAPMCSRD